MYVKRDADGNITDCARNAIPVDSDSGENESGWEKCTDQEEIDAYIESLENA